MFEGPPHPRQQFMKFATSVALHGGLVVLLMHPPPTVPHTRLALPGTSLGTHIELSYQPGRASLKTLLAPKVKPQRVRVAATAMQPQKSTSVPPSAATLSPPPPSPRLAFSQPAPTLSNVQAAVPNTVSGSDSLGNGNIQIALTTYSPSPRPDLSRLPRGIQGDVVLDVTIDPSGNVAEVALLRTLGYGIDEAVMSTVRTWRFRPATRDGVAVSSAQDVLFHFGPV